MRPDLPQPVDHVFHMPAKRFFHDSVDDGTFDVPSAASALFQAYRIVMLIFSISIIWLPVLILWTLLLVGLVVYFT